MTRERLSQHFVIEEFDCKDGTKVPDAYIPALKHLCRVYLEPMREKFGSCRIHSGFRTPEWNVKVGGASASYHVYTSRPVGSGVAADQEYARGSVEQWAEELRALRQAGGGNGGLGVYPRGNFVHYDTRKNGPADWDGP